MMAFTLSKINLLILAIALFAIVSQFAFSFKSIVTADLSKNISGKAMESISMLINSKPLCQKTELRFQRKYSLYGMINFYYVIAVRSIAAERNHLLLSVIKRSDFLKKRDEAPVVASSRMDTNADILIFSYDSKIADPCPVQHFVLDVRAAPNPMDKLSVIKEVFRGKAYLYLIPCSSDVRGLCQRNVQRVGCYMLRKRIKAGLCSSGTIADCISNCFDIDAKECLSSAAPSCWGD